MSINQDSYCRLEHFCEFELIGDKTLKPENSLHYKETDVYVEEYEDFLSVKNSILELNNLWLEKHPEKERYWTESEKKANTFESGLINPSKRDLYPQFLIYNRFGDCKCVGVCYLGWFVSITFFASILDYLEEKYGKEEGIRYDNEISKPTTIFLAPEWTGVSTCELISEEISDILQEKLAIESLRSFSRRMKISKRL